MARREERLRGLAEELGGATVVAADLTEEGAPARVREALESERGGQLHLLVNNAGGAWRGRFGESGWDNVRRHMELNFDAVVRLTEALLPLLRASAPSSIVNVSSTAGRVARGNSGSYSAAKFALAGWTDALHLEEGPNGIHVGLVLPGLRGHRGLPPARAGRAARHTLVGLVAGQGGRRDLGRGAGRQGRALRAAPVLAGRRDPRGRPAARAPSPARRRRGDDARHRRRRPPA